jgi:hypothetical protein
LTDEWMHVRYGLAWQEVVRLEEYLRASNLTTVWDDPILLAVCDHDFPAA